MRAIGALTAAMGNVVCTMDTGVAQAAGDAAKGARLRRGRS